MPKGTTTANDVINAVLRAVDPAWRSGATRYVSLHTATPGAGGDQTTNEATFGSYARVAVTAATPPNAEKSTVTPVMVLLWLSPPAVLFQVAVTVSPTL